MIREWEQSSEPRSSTSKPEILVSVVQFGSELPCLLSEFHLHLCFVRHLVFYSHSETIIEKNITPLLF